MKDLHLIVHMVITALMFAISQVSLLAIFFCPSREVSAHRRIAVYGAAVLLCTLARCLETQKGLNRYISWLVIFAVLCSAALLWRRTRGNLARGVIQRVLCFFLITECTTLALSYLCVAGLGVDPIRRTELPVQIISIIALTALQGTLLLLAWKRFPAEICADAHSLHFSLLSAMPYLFCCQVDYWLPVAYTEVTPAVPLTMVASCLLAVLLISSMEQRLLAEKERYLALTQKHMMELRQQQYICRRDSVEAVRRTYHDMKNLLLYLEKTTMARDEIKTQICQILEDTADYEAMLDTGNEAADILLGEKMVICRKEGILCSVMVDGRLLGFIAEIDLIAILGNAMDNAIEACHLISSGQARYIHVRTRQKPGFLLLQVVNSCTGQSRMKDGHFLTLKKDAESHGFGLSSIQHAVEKYHGEMACRMEEAEFSLSLIFPLDECVCSG